MRRVYKYSIITVLLSIPLFLSAQNSDFNVNGNFEINAQTYKKDSVIDAPEVAEKMLANVYAMLNFSYKNFSAGLRYEAYQNALLGYDRRYNGQGLAHRFISYSNDFVNLTVGNFYEQFGNGLILRSFEDRALGYDNAFDGFRSIIKPADGIRIKALIGKQRYFWTLSDGTIRAVDGEINFNTAFDLKTDFDITIGGSFVSKFQKDQNPVFKLPQNVAASATRINIHYKNFALNAEYAYKINDPSSDNNYIYKPGNATYVSLNYSKKGFGIIVTANRYDNMSFRSDRNATVNNLLINSTPTITNIHSYALENIYPYAVHPTNEMGISGEIFYKIKKKTVLGGKYGTLININFVRINSIQQTPTFDGTGYTSDFFALGKDIYYQEAGIKLERKFSSKLKLKAKYMNLLYNKDLVQGLVGYGTVKANIAVLDVRYKFTFKKTLRFELQSLTTAQDMGHWAMFFAEYSVSPHWYFSVYDQYNYGNPHPEKRVHYFDVSTTYVRGSSRLSIGYGRHREGIICAGGVCRNLPASNGFTVSISSTF